MRNAQLLRTRSGLPLLVAAALALTACTTPEESAGRTASTSRTVDADPIAERAAASDELLQRTLPSDEPGCSAAVGVEGEVVWAGAHGAADISTGRPLEVATTFDIASVSKQFTAAAVLLLAQDDRLALDDPLSRWVPELPAWSDELTIAQLLHHQSGLPDYFEGFLDDGVAITDRTGQQDALDAVAEVVPRFEPGERFEYANINYVLLAEVVRHASGQELPDFARERIFDPLDLAMVIDPFGASPDNDDPSSARAYVRQAANDDWEPGGSRWEQIGDGSIQTTPSELVRWADNYRTGDVGGEDLLAAQLADGADVGGGVTYGAGIFELPDGSLRHSGAWEGFLSDFRISEDRRTAVAVTCNGDSGPSSDGRYVSQVLQQEWID